jgi:hypothetical protein
MPEHAPPPRELVSFAFQRLRSYPRPNYVVYYAEESDTISAVGAQDQSASGGFRVAYRASTQTMSQTDAPPGATLPPARIYSPPFVGPLAYPVDRESLRYGVAGSATGSDSTDSVSTSLSTIATVVAHAAPDYNAVVSSTENIEGRAAYHIRVAAVQDAARFNLRDLWIDVATYDLLAVKYHVDPGAPSNVDRCDCDVTVYFVGIGPYWATAAWESEGPNGFGTSVKRAIRIKYMTFPATLPDWLFDQGAYDRERRSGAPDVIAQILRLKT